MIFLDTSAIVQPFQSSADPLQVEMTRRSSQLLRQIATGMVDATTSEAAVAEAAYVMSGSRFLRQDAREVAATLAALLNSPRLRFSTKPACQRALAIWSERPAIGFVDALTVAYVEQGDLELASFDRQLLASAGVTPYWRETS